MKRVESLSLTIRGFKPFVHNEQAFLVEKSKIPSPFEKWGFRFFILAHPPSRVKKGHTENSGYN